MKVKKLKKKEVIVTVPEKVKVKIGKGKNKQKFKSTKLKCRATRKVLEIWKEEMEFIDGMLALLPATADVDEDLDEYLLDLSDSEERKKRENFLKKTKEILDEQKALKQETKVNNQVVNGDSQEVTVGSVHPKKDKMVAHKPTREELLEKLHAKMALVAQHKNPNKSKVKREKTEGKKDRKKDAKKQFISKTNPNLKGTKSGSKTTVKPEDESSITSYVEIKKTSPRVPAVQNPDGQVVYSKFDFIAPPTQTTKSKPKVTEVLKSVEKAEGKIARLEAIGKKSEAVEVSQGQKWAAALKRAEGQKVRDDPHLLKKTIKKEKKLKEIKKKKWEQRVETVEKAKEAKVKKRQANIEGRRDDKKKKQKKLQRKKGRIL